jgi:predicted ATPase
MSKIKIKNFGPIKEGYLENDGWLDVKKVTVFIGNQGSGKSTVAKLISTFTWIEKALVRGDYDNKWFSRKSKLKNQFLNYHRLENYLLSNGRKSEIEYDGDAYHIKFEKEALSISEKKNVRYDLPQIMYVPAERNFIAYVKSPKELKLSSDSLKEFLTEFDNAKDAIKGSVKLPINNVDLEYDKLNDILNIKGEDYKVRLTESSSGFQSLVPLYLVSDYLSKGIKESSRENLSSMSSEELERFKTLAAEIYLNDNLTSEQRRAALSAISSRFNKTCFINIVEEPEQNLFPSSQQKMLNSLLAFNNLNEGNKLVITTHSPYLINYLTLAVEANKLLIKCTTDELKIKLSEVVPLESTLNGNDLVVYQLDESKGTVAKLKAYKGLPSDENYLNEGLAQSNDEFSKLLDLEDLCQ